MSSPENFDRELNLGAIVKFTVGLVALIVVTGGLMWGLSTALRSYDIAKDPPPPALDEARQPYTPPSPRLQTDPVHEMEALREREAEVLESYGWVEEEAGIARIPIERAIDLYAAGRIRTAGAATEDRAEDGTEDSDGDDSIEAAVAPSESTAAMEPGGAGETP